MKLAVCCFLVFVAVAQGVEWGGVRSKTLYHPRRYADQKLNEGRIVGGFEADRHQFPHQVGLFMDGTYFCGGSLISDTVVLTAGHCADGTGEFEIHLGAQNIWQNNEQDHQVVYSRSYMVHALYNEVEINNDIAFVRIQTPVSGPGLVPIRLPSRAQASNTFAGATVTISGWGAVSDTDTGINSQLKFANVTVITDTECFNIYGSTINGNKICIDTAGGESTCFGDSGGPLTYYEDDGLPTQIGITSFVAGDGCEAGYPAGFTRVTYYLDWLEYNAGVTIRP